MYSCCYGSTLVLVLCIFLSLCRTHPGPMDIDLEEQLKTIEQEYRDGELTFAGYAKRAKKVEKEIIMKDLDNGDLTQRGFDRKMARLDEKYSVASSTQEVVASPCSIASTLATSPTIRHEVRRLYGRVDQSTRTSRSGATFNVSALATKKQSSIKEKSKKLKKDRVVVVCMPVTQFTLPRRKKRDQLVSAGFVKELSVADDATEKELQAQLDMLFPGHTSFIFLSVLQSHELVPATLPHGDSEWTGASLLTLVHNGSIYVRPKAQKKNKISLPLLFAQYSLLQLQSFHQSPHFFLWLPLCQSNQHVHLLQLVYPFNRLVLCCHVTLLAQLNNSNMW